MFLPLNPRPWLCCGFPAAPVSVAAAAVEVADGAEPVLAAPLPFPPFPAFPALAVLFAILVAVDEVLAPAPPGLIEPFKIS
jgi:hypothetical protein